MPEAKRLIRSKTDFKHSFPFFLPPHPLEKSLDTSAAPVARDLGSHIGPASSGDTFIASDTAVPTARCVAGQLST